MNDASLANLTKGTPFKPGESGNPDGRKEGSVNRKTILNHLLFEADIDEMGVLKNKPSWWDKVKPKTIYEVMTLAMAVQAMNGDSKAFNALNRAIGVDINAGGQIDVVHIFKPEKLTEDSFNEAGAKLVQHNREVLEAELIDERMESPIGTTDSSLTGA